MEANELVVWPKTSLKWAVKASKELIKVLWESQIAHAQSNARPVSRGIRNCHLRLLGNKLLGLHLDIERDLKQETASIQPSHPYTEPERPWDWLRQMEVG